MSAENVPSVGAMSGHGMDVERHGTGCDARALSRLTFAGWGRFA